MGYHGYIIGGTDDVSLSVAVWSVYNISASIFMLAGESYDYSRDVWMHTRIVIVGWILVWWSTPIAHLTGTSGPTVLCTFVIFFLSDYVGARCYSLLKIWIVTLLRWVMFYLYSVRENNFLLDKIFLLAFGFWFGL